MRELKLYVAYEQNGEAVASSVSRDDAKSELQEQTGNAARGSFLINITIPYNDEGRPNVQSVEEFLLHADGADDVLDVVPEDPAAEAGLVAGGDKTPVKGLRDTDGKLEKDKKDSGSNVPPVGNTGNKPAEQSILGTKPKPDSLQNGTLSEAGKQTGDPGKSKAADTPSPTNTLTGTGTASGNAVTNEGPQQPKPVQPANADKGMAPTKSE